MHIKFKFPICQIFPSKCKVTKLSILILTFSQYNNDKIWSLYFTFELHLQMDSLSCTIDVNLKDSVCFLLTMCQRNYSYRIVQLRDDNGQCTHENYPTRTRLIFSKPETILNPIKIYSKLPEPVPNPIIIIKKKNPNPINFIYFN